MAEKDKLEGKLGEIVDMLIDGLSYRKIAEHFKVNLRELHSFTSDEKHSAYVREALSISASTYVDKAEDALLNAKGTPVEIQRARELAQHYRWAAAKRNPKKFGDKLDVVQQAQVRVIRADWSGKSTEELKELLRIEREARGTL